MEYLQISARLGKLYKTREGDWLVRFNDDNGYKSLILNPFTKYDFELKEGMEFWFGVEYLMNNPLQPVAYIPF